ncbi:NAD(P)/FAD-dependent oxidoreductase [Paraferrimonas sp. SM1919]|uniref:NAD(P)/FAD-dependent oxidoreductase n=1 Tax=Paraferrimonas sp. SM1919 TaxID=2662263 RepID=UPI0013D3647E|nr:FAD-dependent oxidoreductase [Paraferrimonas sp. SM1919]
MKIAIIGSGISALTCAHLLSEQHQVEVFEKNHYIGGHTNTVSVEVEGKTHRVDTGFIVFNDRTYPNFLKLLDRIGFRPKASEMSFSCRNELTGLEYNGHNLNTLFSQRKNIFSPKFYKLISEIVRFNNQSKALHSSNQAKPLTLGDLINDYDFSEHFSEHYILPMVAAIWSCSLEDAAKFPIDFFLNFFSHHGLLNINDRPQWFVLEGGSSSYINDLTAPFADNIHLNTGVLAITRHENGVTVTTEHGSQEFDEVVLACHSDQALALLSDKTEDEQTLLSKMKYQSNVVQLHQDESLMPKHKLSWASWNFLLEDKAERSTDPALVSYYMNRLQGFKDAPDFFVTLNGAHKVDKDKVLREFIYEHPVMDEDMINTQKQRQLICGKNHTHFAGAYWYNGFHEDGVKSALDVCKRFGISL